MIDSLDTIQIDALPVGIVVIDVLSRKIVNINKAAQKLIGAEASEIIGHSCHKFICPAAEGKCPILDMGQSVDNAERQLLTSSGKLITILKTANKVTINGQMFLYEVLQDVTDPVNLRKQLQIQVAERTKELAEINSKLVREIKNHEKTELKLNELFTRYSMFFNNCNDGLTLIDFSGSIPPGKYIEVNKAFCQMVNYSREELLQLTPLDLTAPDMKDYALANTKLVLESEYAVLRFPNVYITKDGRRLDCEINASFVYLAGREVAVVVYRDISETKRLEQSLREAYESELQAHAEVEDQLNQRNYFMRALVHELKTPLTPLLASSEYLVSELSDSTLLGYARNMQNGAINLNNKIDDLMNLAKGEIGQLQIDPEYADIRKVIGDCIDYLQPQAQKMQKRIVLNFDGDIPLTLFDKTMIHQVVLNLLSNSLKFSRIGSEICIAALKSGDNIRVSVKDQGTGIPKGKQQGIFTPYYRIKTKRDRYGGLGLGLALSKMIVELHRGEIWFTSEYGHGSTFYFTLPIRSEWDEDTDNRG
ncbi:ATP-binding protein [Dehalococcoides sp.]|jgi:PAS domain S-box-containing protein|uniref:sensor histidine kinase n=1 Tax=Dehalococcoides sp. TaxID=1966486 RepID=UPI003562C155